MRFELTDQTQCAIDLDLSARLPFRVERLRDCCRRARASYPLPTLILGFGAAHDDIIGNVLVGAGPPENIFIPRGRSAAP